MKKVSVVITTYNGIDYIKDQLNSILDQTRQPDEVLIFDDRSSDNTKYLIQSYIEEKELKNWSLIVNESNLGWKKNFIQGFKRAKGDIIFPCDQDDIWDCHKIEKMCKAIEKNDKIKVLCCNLTPIGKKNEIAKIPSYNLKKYGKNKIERVEFNKFWVEPMRQGCTMAFSKELINDISLEWFPDCAHDLLLWAIGMATNSLYIYNENLILFRRHSGTNTPSNKKENEIRKRTRIIEVKLAENIIDKNRTAVELNGEKMQEMLSFYRKRLKSIEDKNIHEFIKMLKYIGYYPQKKAIVGDFISTFSS